MKQDRAALAAICLGAFLAILTGSMFTVAYPAVRQEFDLGYSGLTWMNVLYFLVFAVGMPLCGAFGDRVGHPRSYTLGVALFLLSSAVGALAPTFLVLLGSQLLGALAAAMMMPAGMALIRRLFGLREGWAFGYWIMATSAASLAGPLIGGGLLEMVGWRGIFGLDTLVCGAVLALTVGAMRGLPALGQRRPVDVLGGVFLFFTCAALQGWLKVGLSQRIGSPLSLVLLAAFFAAALLLIRRERRAAHPLVPLELLTCRPFVITSLVGLLLMTAVQGLSFFAPSYLQEARAMSPVAAGALLMTEAIVLVALSPLTGRAADRLPPVVPVVLGTMAFAAGVLPFAVPGGVDLVLIGLGLALEGIGQGFAMPALNKSALAAVPATSVGVAMGVYNMVRFSGGAFAGAVFGPLLDGTVDELQASLAPEVVRQLAFEHVFLLIALISLAAAGLAIWLRPAAEPATVAHPSAETA